MIEAMFHRTSGTALVRDRRRIHCIVIIACYVDVLLLNFMGHGSSLSEPSIYTRPTEGFPGLVGYWVL